DSNWTLALLLFVPERLSYPTGIFTAIQVDESKLQAGIEAHLGGDNIERREPSSPQRRHGPDVGQAGDGEIHLVPTGSITAFEDEAFGAHVSRSDHTGLAFSVLKR